MKRLLIILGVCAVSSSAFTQDIAPSFDCKKATTLYEKEICADNTLATLDRHVADTYSKILKELSPAEAKTLRKNQKDWVAVFRGVSCQTDTRLKGCLTEYYNDRVKYLDTYLSALHQPANIRNLAGIYDFKEPHMAGDLEFFPTSATTAWAHISTGTEKGTCEFEGNGSLKDNIAILSNADTPDCKVRIIFSGSTTTVDTGKNTCHYWCGVHAWFDGKYIKK